MGSVQGWNGSGFVNLQHLKAYLQIRTLVLFRSLVYKLLAGAESVDSIQKVIAVLWVHGITDKKTWQMLSKDNTWRVTEMVVLFRAAHRLTCTCTAWWFDIIDPYWFHWEVQNICCHCLISALKLLQQTESTYSSFSVFRNVMLHFHNVLYTDKSGKPASSTWRFALAHIGEYLTTDRQLEEEENLAVLWISVLGVFTSLIQNIVPHSLDDRFLRDFFGITKYLVVFYYCFSFQSYNYGMKWAFLCPSPLFYFMIAHKHVSLFLYWYRMLISKDCTSHRVLLYITVVFFSPSLGYGNRQLGDRKVWWIGSSKRNCLAAV